MGRRNAGNDCSWNVKEYTSMVINAHVSLGSHPQYRPHETFAHTAPVNIPTASKKTAGYNMMRLMSVNRLRIAVLLPIRFMMSAVTPLKNKNAKRE